MRFPRFSRRTPPLPHAPAILSFYNSRGGEKQPFTLPMRVKEVRMYNCGPTLYGPQHIGNLSMFVFADTLRRVLEYNGFAVKQVINFTDFGHLSSDADEGDDKMTTGLKREGLEITMSNMRALAGKYAAVFLDDLQLLNVATDKITFPYASDYVPAQIAMIKALEEKGYAYRGEDGVYFDTARFARYGELGGISANDGESRVMARQSKRHPQDFVLWKSSDAFGWESPWGQGFPGWHIECSAMVRAILGEQIDIHTGGIEHIAIHHNNEIAQSECATGKSPFSRFWLHRAHVQIDGGKISKSVGNVIYLSPDVTEKYHPLALRYLFLGAHYRTATNFTWEALEAAQTAYLKLRAFVMEHDDADGVPAEGYRARIHERLNDDLDTAGALAILWEMMRDSALAPADKRATILNIDTVFGLKLHAPDERADAMYAALFGKFVPETEWSDQLRDIIKRRAIARDERKWEQADALRDELGVLGYTVEDASEGLRVYKRR